MSVVEFKHRILDYLVRERDLYQQDIELNRNLSEEAKVFEGLLILDAEVVDALENEYVFKVTDNYTKLRPGDSVTLYHTIWKNRKSATIIDNATEEVIVRCNETLKIGDFYHIEVEEFVLLDPLIHLMESLEEGAPGMGLLKVMAGEVQPPKEKVFGRIDIETIGTIPSSLNERQRDAISAIFKRPSFYCLQGPPGTGKTYVLGLIAYSFSKKGAEVMVLAKTHQAVNNALNAIRKVDKESCVVKIGEELKAIDLNDDIIQATTYNKYIIGRKLRKKGAEKYGDIVGMTMQAGIVNLGLRNQGFKPQIVLIDEASQIPLCEAAWLGTSGAGTIVFIGDEHQMPPIYHTSLERDELSQSIFSFLHGMFPDLFISLDTTFRMNEEITQLVSRNFYEPSGIKLISHPSAKDRKLSLSSKNSDPQITKILTDEQSVFVYDVTRQNIWEDNNTEEAGFIARLIDEVLQAGLSFDDIAVVTPFRRQVRTIREACNELLEGNLPLIDTVERLQGQDVKMVIISLCVSNPEYYNKQRKFLLNPNRLNVMVSRAKMKVLILKPDIVELDLGTGKTETSKQNIGLAEVLTQELRSSGFISKYCKPVININITNQFNGPVGQVIQ